MIDLVKEESRVDQQVRRASKLGLPATLTIDDWMATLTIFNGLCAYCRQNAFEVLEHIIPLSAGGGTTIDNCVPACQRRNTRRREHVAPDARQGESHDKAIERILAFLQTHPSIPRKLTTSSVGRTDMTFRLPIALMERLRTQAEQHHRSLVGELLVAVEEYLYREERKPKRD